MKKLFKAVLTGDDSEGNRDLEDGAITDNMARKTQIIDFFIVILIFIGNGLFYFEVTFSQ